MSMTANGFAPIPYRRDPDELVVCPQCNRGDDGDAHYCDQCDFDLTSTGFRPAPYYGDADDIVICPNCNLGNDPDAHFCDQCGIQLEGAQVRIVGASAGDVDQALRAARGGRATGTA